MEAPIGFLVFLGVIVVAFGIAVGLYRNSAVMGIIVGILCAGIVVFSYIRAIKRVKPQYEALIDKTVSAVDFHKRYTIIEQLTDNLYIIEDRQQEK